MDRLKRGYERTAKEYGVLLRHFCRGCPRFDERLKGMDAIVIFTNMVSHNAKKRAFSKGKAAGIPVFMCHSCGLSSLKRCLKGIKKEN
jgi:hypothetical protein